MTTAVPVLRADEAAALDQATIAAGTPSRALMQRAGAAAASEIARRYAGLLAGGVAVHAGPGNNGGDAYVIAAALARAGVRVGLATWGGDAPRTDDARFDRARAIAAGVDAPPTGAERVAIDGVLGVGATGAPRGWAADAIAAIARARAGGATIVALDVPSGLDATTGETHGGAIVRADLTLTFGSCKRGLLVAREHAGAVAVLDIGLDRASDDAPRLVAPPAPRPFAPSAHKGARGKVVVYGGGDGMAGAALLAGRAALRSGAGLVKLIVGAASVPVVQGGLPSALAAPWPTEEAGLRRVVDWADAVLIGPGMGEGTRERCERLLHAWRGPVVVDADALNAFAGDAASLGALLRGRPALVTPHPLECARLAGVSLDDVLAARYDLPRELAATLGGTVLLKGTPTVVADADGTLVVATGAPALATGGSGDVLGGIAATLLAQAPSTRVASLAAEAAWVHDRAGARVAARRGGARGATLDEVLDALGDAWPRGALPATYPALAELPAVLG